MTIWKKALKLSAALSLAFYASAEARTAYGSCAYATCGPDGPTYEESYLTLSQCCSLPPRQCPNEAVVFPMHWNGYDSSGPEVCM